MRHRTVPCHIGGSPLKNKIQYGGQAVIEGVMMRGSSKVSTAIRKPDGEILVDKRDVNSITRIIPFLKLPLLRGVVALVESLVLGIQMLMFSANQSMEEEEELSPIELTATLTISIGLFVLLFIVVPNLLAVVTKRYIEQILMVNLVEGLIRVGIFLIYLYSVSRIKEIQRVFQYHGAEHKVINTYEAGEELTVENSRAYSRFHPRCGTSFLFLVMILSIFFFSLLGEQSILMRIVTRILLLPALAGISYEAIKFAGRNSRNFLVRLVIQPGLWLQRLTTLEPDDSQLEVAIEALKDVLAREAEEPAVG